LEDVVRFTPTDKHKDDQGAVICHWRADTFGQLQLKLADHAHWFNNFRIRGALGLSPQNPGRPVSYKLSAKRLIIHTDGSGGKRFMRNPRNGDRLIDIGISNFTMILI